MGPPKLKGLLSREAPTKGRYDAARPALLGLGGQDGPFASVG